MCRFLVVFGVVQIKGAVKPNFRFSLIVVADELLVDLDRAYDSFDYVESFEGSLHGGENLF